MCGGTPRAPTPPPAVPEAPRAPAVKQDGTTADRDRRRRAAAGGTGQSTILTGSRGVQDGGTTTTKTLLGQ